MEEENNCGNSQKRIKASYSAVTYFKDGDTVHILEVRYKDGVIPEGNEYFSEMLKRYFEVQKDNRPMVRENPKITLEFKLTIEHTIP